MKFSEACEEWDWHDAEPDGNWGAWYYAEEGHKIIMSYRSIMSDPEDEHGESITPGLKRDKYPQVLMCS